MALVEPFRCAPRVAVGVLCAWRSGALAGAAPAAEPPGPSAAVTCEGHAFVVDADPKGVRVRSAPRGTTALFVIPRDAEGTMVELAQGAGDWVRIRGAEGLDAGFRSKAQCCIYALLLVVLATDPQTSRLGGANDQLLVCRGCGGVKKGVRIGIEKGVLIVEQGTGSREYTEQTWRFRFDAASGRFRWIGMDLENADGLLGTGERHSHNLLTSLKIIERLRDDAKGVRSVAATSRRSGVVPGVMYLEEGDGSP